jgi:Rha family phage regulatory protein
MEELVYKGNDGKPVTNSLLIAEKFGKRHSGILRVIQSIKDVDWTERNFVLTSYKDKSGKYNNMYIVSRDGFSMLAMGFTGEKAFQFKKDFIAAFNQMETALVQLPKDNERLDRLEKMVENLIQLTTTALSQPKQIEIKQDYYTILGFCRLNNRQIAYSEAVQKGKLARKLSIEKDIEIKKVSDEKYGFVNSYKESILKETFSL